jgi:hypothetical protein
MNFSSMSGGTLRFAQTFTAATTGGLTAAQVDVRKQGTAGDYRLDINEVDAAGVPTDGVLASTTIPDADVPAGESTITGSFASPAQVSAGAQYALIVTRPASNVIQVGVRTGNDCPGQLFFSSAQTGPFSPLGDTNDLVFAVFVLENDPPETTLTAAPKDKTKKKWATFSFSADEPATFSCVLDGKQEFKPCTSPITVKVKKGKHSFSVAATDAAGNVDPSAAVDDWKVKKVKKKKRKR